jgi:dCTP diphosphatase
MEQERAVVGHGAALVRSVGSVSRDDLHELTATVRAFADARDWGQFHTPKNLSMALAGEAGELLEVFQWLTPDECATLSIEQRQAAGLEMADVLIYLVRLADVLGIDLLQTSFEKIQLNETRYPVSSTFGSAAKAAHRPTLGGASPSD